MRKDNQFHIIDIINLFLILTNLGMVFYICYLAYLKEDPRATMLRSSVRSSRGLQGEETVLDDSFKPFSYYKADLQEKDIFQGFKPPKKPPRIKKPKKIEPVKIDTTIEDIKRHFQVLGILLDENPSVLIKDWRNNQTVILSVGEKIEKAVLKEILEGKIILEYNQERFEMEP